MKRNGWASLGLLVVALAVLTVSSPARAAAPPPLANLFDDFGRSAVCVDYSTGSFYWEILQGPGAGNYYEGVGQVRHTTGPWQVIFASPTMNVNVVYVESNPHGAGGLWVSSGGGGGEKSVTPGGAPITSALYDTGAAPDRQSACGGTTPSGEPPIKVEPPSEGGTSVAEDGATPPVVTLPDDFGRCCVTLDFTDGSFLWQIESGPWAGLTFGGQGTVYHTVGPWQILFQAPWAAISAVYVESNPHGAGSLWLSRGGGGKIPAPGSGIPVTSALYYTNTPVDGRQQCGGD